MEPKTTVFFIGGISGSGKSTRIYALVQYLESKNLRTDYMTHCDKIVGRTYLDGSLSIIGKEVNRGMDKAWQGVDVFSKLLSDDRGHDGLYEYFYNIAKNSSLLLDSAILLRTNRSRPLFIEENNVDIKTYSRNYWYKSFDTYKKRIYDRTNGRILTEDSTMWGNNSDFPCYYERCKEEIAQSRYPERYEVYLGDPEEPVSTIGEEVLKRIGREDLITEFIEFCKTIPLKNKVDYKVNSLF